MIDAYRLICCDGGLRARVEVQVREECAEIHSDRLRVDRVLANLK